MSISRTGGLAQTPPEFEPQMTKDGRWYVSVKTGNGPDSHIGDFETERMRKTGLQRKQNIGRASPNDRE
jgi:hypothetical protein